jgi:hypothetical protein
VDGGAGEKIAGTIVVADENFVATSLQAETGVELPAAVELDQGDLLPGIAADDARRLEGVAGKQDVSAIVKDRVGVVATAAEVV